MTTKTDKNANTDTLQAIETLIAELDLPLPAKKVSASFHAGDRVVGSGMQALNANELKSVYALLAYVAHNENIQQETVQAIVEANFRVNHIEKLQHRDYDEVIRFLVDLRIDELRN